jgi:hypothetical protein
MDKIKKNRWIRSGNFFFLPHASEKRNAIFDFFMPQLPEK